MGTMNKMSGFARSGFECVAKAGKAVMAFFRSTKPAMKTNFQPTAKQLLAVSPVMGMTRPPILNGGM
jgi:hypothetical protein